MISGNGGDVIGELDSRGALNEVTDRSPHAVVDAFNRFGPVGLPGRQYSTTRPRDTLLAMFTAPIDERDGAPVIHVPEQEIDLCTLAAGDTYRVAFLAGPDSAGETADGAESRSRRGTPRSSEPPVGDGERIDVEIEDVGEQGDGIARVGPGYVIFVPGTDIGDRVTIEITETRDNCGFAEVVTPEPVTGRPTAGRRGTSYRTVFSRPTHHRDVLPSALDEVEQLAAVW